MDEQLIEFIDYPDLNLNITEYNPEFKILNDRGDKASSGVWQHFGTIQHMDAIDRKHVYCILCFCEQKMKKYQRSTSTGNLSKHLRKQHNISLSHTFRVKRESDKIVQIIKKEDDFDLELDKSNENLNSTDGSDEFLTNDINEILIAEVARRPMLYKTQTNQQEKGVKLALRRQQWMEIYETLNRMIPLERLPKIWKNIRDRYHKVKRISSIRGLDRDSRPKYRYFEMLHFLDSVNEEEKSFESNKSGGEQIEQIEQIEEEGNVDEYLITGDHDHYISTEAIVVPTGNVYNDVSFEQKPKRATRSTKKRKVTNTETYEIITPQLCVKPDNSGIKRNKMIEVLSSNIIEESYANANEMYTPFEEELVTEDATPIQDIQHNEILDSDNIDVAITSSNTESSSTRKPDECEMFGNFVAEVMRNMTKPRLRTFQMKVLKLISETENE